MTIYLSRVENVKYPYSTAAKGFGFGSVSFSYRGETRELFWVRGKAWRVSDISLLSDHLQGSEFELVVGDAGRQPPFLALLERACGAVWLRVLGEFCLVFL